MAAISLPLIYRDYIDCLNAQDWRGLERFVDPDVIHNDRAVGLGGYRAMLERNFRDIPDLQFDARLLLCDGDMIASRLRFDCTPAGSFLGLPVNGKRVLFFENVFYRFEQARIRQVWSIVDRAAIEEQLRP